MTLDALSACDDVIRLCLTPSGLLQLLENAAGVVGSSGDLAAQFDAAAQNSLTVVRMFGFGTQGGFQLQYSPGSYNEKAFQAFDKVFANSTHRIASASA